MTPPRPEWAHRGAVIGIDPDTAASGVAVAIGSELADVRVVPTTAAEIFSYITGAFEGICYRERGRVPEPVLAVIEMPAARGRAQVRREDLLALALVVGRWQQALENEGIEVHLAPSSDWKGSVSKTETEQRLLEGITLFRSAKPPILSIDERALIPAVKRGKVTKAQRGEMIDAVGIAMWALGRYR